MAKPKKNINEDGTLKVYAYHPDTGAFAGERAADPNPLEPGEYLIPAFATVDAPPAASESQLAIYDGEKWLITERPAAPEKQQLTTEQLASMARAERNALLAACDYVMLPDVPLTAYEGAHSDWLAYRQMLRDIPQKPGFPENINWPKKPGNV